MIIVEYEKWRKGRTRTHEAQVDEAEIMNLNDGALILSTRGGTVIRIFASGEWKNATLLREVTITNQAGGTLIKETVASRASYGLKDAA